MLDPYAFGVLGILPKGKAALANWRTRHAGNSFVGEAHAVALELSEIAGLAADKSMQVFDCDLASVEERLDTLLSKLDDCTKSPRFVDRAT
jgi:hypothetical protein